MNLACLQIGAAWLNLRDCWAVAVVCTPSVTLVNFDMLSIANILCILHNRFGGWRDFFAGPSICVYTLEMWKGMISAELCWSDSPVQRKHGHIVFPCLRCYFVRGRNMTSLFIIPPTMASLVDVSAGVSRQWSHEIHWKNQTIERYCLHCYIVN